jgi:hypothetical protein
MVSLVRFDTNKLQPDILRDGELLSQRTVSHEEEIRAFQWLTTSNLEVRTSSIYGAGKGVFALCNLKEGDEVVTSANPFASVVTRRKLSSVCHGCFRVNYHDNENAPIKLKHCSTCKVLHYCSLLCQKQDWRTHQKECHIIYKQRGSELVDLFRLMIRFLSQWCYYQHSTSESNALELILIRTWVSRK